MVMQKFFKKYSTILIGIALLICNQSLFAENSIACHSSYKGQSLSRQTLLQVLHHQNGNINLCGTNLHAADLSDLDLSGVDLQGADLSEAKLKNTNLSGAKLYKTYFRWADLTGADLQRSDLRSASLESAKLNQANLTLARLNQANLTQADLSSASLQHADLTSANLTDATLKNANFQWANLTDANLSWSNLTQTIFSEAILKRTDLANTLMDQTNFSEADLSGANFQPKLGSLPDLIALSTAKQFQTIQFDEKRGLPPLLEIRAAYKKIGLIGMERQITAIVKTKQMQQAWHQGGWSYVESAFNFVFFYLTCDFGAAPGRALVIFLLLMGLFTLPYYLALLLPRLGGGIFVYWQSNKDSRHDEHTVAKKGLEFKKRIKFADIFACKGWVSRYWRLLRIAFYFSILNAFSLGWHELNARSWMRRIQLRDYQLKGYGWVKVLSGIQPLLSAYLIVLWALTYFGHPFEW